MSFSFLTLVRISPFHVLCLSLFLFFSPVLTYVSLISFLFLSLLQSIFYSRLSLFDLSIFHNFALFPPFNETYCAADAIFCCKVNRSLFGRCCMWRLGTCSWDKNTREWLNVHWVQAVCDPRENSGSRQGQQKALSTRVSCRCLDMHCITIQLCSIAT